MSSLFHWSDTVAIWTHNIVEPITVISNLYLIFIAVLYSPAPMKVYSSLIIYHSAFDVSASFSIFMASPRFVSLRRARMYVFHGVCHHIGGPHFCYIWNDFMIHALAHSMLSIAVSFCYRYYILTARNIIMKKMLAFLFLIWTPSLFQLITFYFAQDPNETLMDIAKDYPPYDKYLEMVVYAGNRDYLEWKTLISNLYLGCGAGTMFPITYFIRSLIIKKLQENTTMSEKTKQMHANLLRVLSFQSISPMIFTILFIPFALMSLDIYRHPIMENSIFGFCGLIPATDSFVNLIFIKTYRQAVLSHIMKLLKICKMSDAESGSASFVGTNETVNDKEKKGSPFAYDSEDPKNRNAQVVSKALKVWYDYQFTLVITSLQILFMVLIGVWGRYDRDELPGGDENFNKINAQYPMFQDIHIMVFAGFGFLMTFLRRYGYSSVALNFVLAAFTIEWAVVLRGFIFQLPQMPKFHIGLEMLIESDFIAATILISMGAMLGKLSPIQYLIMALIEVPVAIGIEHIVIQNLNVNDVGGSLTIHCFGAYFGMACSAAFAKKIHREHENEGSAYHSDIFSMIGTIFLWCYWPSFNAADAEPEDARQRAVANTYLSLVACTVTTFIVTQLVHPHKKFDMMHIANATLAGGVGVGTAANAILFPLDAMIVGVTVGIVSTLGFKYLTPLLNKIGIHDTCGVHNLHGMPSVIAGISATIFAVAYNLNDYGIGVSQVYPGISRHSNGSWNAGKQAVHQFLGLLIVWGAGLLAGAVTGLFLRLPIWRQVSDEEHFADSEFFETPGDYDFVSKHSANGELFEAIKRRISVANSEVQRLPY